MYVTSNYIMNYIFLQYFYINMFLWSTNNTCDSQLIYFVKIFNNLNIFNLIAIAAKF